jgi:hypothetical protein
VISARKAFENNPNKTLVSDAGGRNGLDIVFNCTNVPPDALTALEAVATYLEGLFSDSITVSIGVNYMVLDPNVIGATSNQMVYPQTPWTTTRACFINDMDADDSIQLWLPSGSTIPVRYNYSSPTATNVGSILYTRGNYNAVIGFSPGSCAQVTFNSIFPFDYDPSDGITSGTMCFQSVAAHEIGHVLGFISAADFWPYNTCALDIYRFQFSDSIFNYNPDNFSEFQTTARMVDQSPGNNDVISDMIADEYRMSDGDPAQCSHFAPNIVYAIMGPYQSYGETYYPNFYKVPDRTMFDAIGWSYLQQYSLTLTSSGNGTVTTDPDTTWFNPGATVELTANPAAGYQFGHWSGDHTGSNNPDTITMDYDKEIVAHFETENCTLTINVTGNGVVERNPNLPYYPRGSGVELTAVPDTGWAFQYWYGHLSGSQNPDTIIMNGDKTVNVVFTQTGVEEIPGELVEATFLDAFPNPFSNRLTIEYGIAASDGARSADLTIFDVTGQLIKQFSLPRVQQQGSVRISWDGTDNIGRNVPSGVYFVRFKTRDSKITKQMLLLR